MRQEEYDPLYVISYTPDDIASIREALKQYSELIRSGKGFEDNYCVAHFEPTTDISLSDFERHPALLKYIKTELRYKDDDLKEQLLTETLCFLCAAKYPELEGDIVAACESIVFFARSINDSSKMWITSESPFGLEPLDLLATLKPKYGYLLAGFFVPYWDDEHMPEALSYLGAWSDKFGITPDTIKAFCYCDHSSAREYMLGYSTMDGMDETERIESQFDLIEHFRNNPEAFQLFKDLLVTRFQEQLFLQYTDDVRYYNNNPLRTMVMDIMMLHYPSDTWDDDFDIDEYLTQTFINGPAEEEIAEIKSYVEDKLGRTIVPSIQEYKAKISQEIEKTPTKNHPFDNWKTFITQAVKNGDKVWAYIEEGTDKSVLETLEKMDIYSSSKKGKFDLYKELDEHAFNMKYVWRYLDDIINPLFDAFYEDVIMEVEKQDAWLIRFLEVIFRLNGKESFNSDTVTLIIEDFELCDQETFEKVFSINWYQKLENRLSEIKEFADDIYGNQVEKCWKIIDENRSEAVEKLPNTLFSITDEDNDLIIELLITASYIISQDSKVGRDDALTQASKVYVEQYALDKLLLDLRKDTLFPSDDTIQTSKSGSYAYPAHKDYIEGIMVHYPDFLAFEQFIRQGHVMDGEKRLSYKASEEKALAILEKNLEYDDVISDKLREVNWLRNFSDQTQKLLYVAHLAGTQPELSCSHALNRLLKLIFTLAPVRMTHMLAKAYKDDRRDDWHDNVAPMLDMLDGFKSQGLSDEGYWAFQFQQFAGRYESYKQPYYKQLLAEWSEMHKPVPVSFLQRIHQRQRNALKIGLQYLSYSTQSTIVDDAASAFPQNDYSKIYDRQLFELFIRKLKAKFSLNDLPIYFKNRLEAEGINCQFVEWDEWHNHNELLQQILQDTPVDQRPPLTKEACQEQLSNKKEWQYLVLKRDGDQLMPVLGKEELWLLRNGFDSDNIYQAQIKAIIIDDTCPQEHIDELLSWSQVDYKKEWLKVSSYLLGGSPLRAVEHIIRYGINPDQFSSRESFYEASLNDLLLKASEHVRGNTLRFLGMVSHECLDITTGLSKEAYLDMLMENQVDRKAIFKMLVEQEQFRLIPKIALKVDVSPFVVKEKIAVQIQLLSILAPFPQYHPLVISLERSKSSKLRNHIEQLYIRYHIKTKEAVQCHIVDYGVYVMEGNTDPQSGSTRKTAREPLCTLQTTQIKGEPDTYFGLRFTATHPETAPKVLVHQVTVSHPYRNPETNEVIQYTSQWTQNGYSNSNIFLGWYFDPKEELLTGQYHMTAHDTDGNLLAEKTFEVI
ncbi:DUF3859 domain-containing protein [Limibacter armeniacum]|uniref:DUF3859 domain-containing protein n=1 Tax=Limibacter armeniacum TaxID=466084 RepID=UPI002FE5F6CB